MFHHAGTVCFICSPTVFLHIVSWLYCRYGYLRRDKGHRVMLFSFGGWCGTCRLWGFFRSFSYNWHDLEGTIEVLFPSPLLSDYWVPQGDQFACSTHTSHDRRPYHTLYPKSKGMRSLRCVTTQTFPSHKWS